MTLEQEEVERRVDALVRELDEIFLLCADPETAPLVATERRGIGQARMRCDLILAALRAQNGQTV
jgi:hypothetical protein